MAVVLMLNVGNSDIQVKGERLRRYKSDCMDWIRLLEADVSASQELELPIIRPMLDEIFTREGHAADELVLFVTNQPESVPEKYRNQDTLEAGNLVQRLLGNEVKVQLVVITSEPNDYAVMHQWFAAALPQVLASLEEAHGPIEHVYMGISGGTPACNFNLALSMLETVSAPLTALYVSERTQKVVTGDFVGMMRRTQVMRLFRTLLSSDDYSAAIELAQVAWPSHKGLHALLKALNKLQLFRFVEASQQLTDWPKGYSKRFIDIKDHIQKADKGVTQINQGELKLIPSDEAKTAISEMWYQARAKYEHGEYVDFVMRFCGMRETLLLHRAQAHAGKVITTREHKQEEAYQVCRRHEPESEFMQWVTQSESIRTLRNSLWVTHGLGGVTCEQITKLWKGTRGIVEDTSNLLANTFGITEPSPSEHAKLLLEELVANLTETSIQTKRL